MGGQEKFGIGTKHSPGHSRAVLPAVSRRGKQGTCTLDTREVIGLVASTTDLAVLQCIRDRVTQSDQVI